VIESNRIFFPKVFRSIKNDVTSWKMMSLRNWLLLVLQNLQNVKLLKMYLFTE